MNGENIKKVYVVNLDNKRVIMLTGLFFLLFGISFFAGLKWNLKDTGNVVNSTESINAMADTGDERPLSTNIAGKENNVLALPDEDTRIFNQQAKQEKNDPFLAEPPNHATIKHSGLRPTDKKLSGEDHERTGKTENKFENPGEKYYTIQVAAFAHEKDALAYQNRLKKKDIESRVEQGKKYYYVRSGKAADKGSLQPLLKKINNTMKLQAFVVQRKLS